MTLSKVLEMALVVIYLSASTIESTGESVFVLLVLVLKALIAHCG
jgi:hypothetical protein